MGNIMTDSIIYTKEYATTYYHSLQNATALRVLRYYVSYHHKVLVSMD